VEAKREQKHQAKAQAEHRLEAIAESGTNSKKGTGQPDMPTGCFAHSQSEVFPRLDIKPIQEITPPEILDVVRCIEKRGALEVASRVLQRVNAVFRYAIQTGRATYNPAADLAGNLECPPFIRVIRPGIYTKAYGRADRNCFHHPTILHADCLLGSLAIAD
jgi:hypothetical protein